MEAEVSYLVKGSQQLFGRSERYEEFVDAAQAAWRLAMRNGTTAMVVDEADPELAVVGETHKQANPLQPHEPVIVFNDLRPDAAIRARRSLVRFLERVGRYPFPAVTVENLRFSPSRGAVPRAEERERIAAPIRAAWAEL
jgi:hypothetical protein